MGSARNVLLCKRKYRFQSKFRKNRGTYSKYAGIDDKIENLHYYTTYIKFGIGRATFDAGQESKNEKITREEAIGLVKKFDHEFPKVF